MRIRLDSDVINYSHQLASPCPIPDARCTPMEEAGIENGKHAFMCFTAQKRRRLHPCLEAPCGVGGGMGFRQVQAHDARIVQRHVQRRVA